MSRHDIDADMIFIDAIIDATAAIDDATLLSLRHFAMPFISLRMIIFIECIIYDDILLLILFSLLPLMPIKSRLTFMPLRLLIHYWCH